jgi:hypothetical protein
VSLKINDDVFLQDTITTGDGARMEMVLDSTVLVSMPERTVVTISEVSGRGTLDLDAGQLTVNVRGDRPQSGQALEIRTPNAVATLRGGARLRVETVSPAPQSRSSVTHIDVLDGNITVVINVDFGNQLLYRGATPSPIDMGPNQGLTITGEVPRRDPSVACGFADGVAPCTHRHGTDVGVPIFAPPRISDATRAATVSITQTAYVAFIANTNGAGFSALGVASGRPVA